MLLEAVAVGVGDCHAAAKLARATIRVFVIKKENLTGSLFT